MKTVIQIPCRRQWKGKRKEAQFWGGTNVSSSSVHIEGPDLTYTRPWTGRELVGITVNGGDELLIVHPTLPVQFDLLIWPLMQNENVASK